jgi:hypothetical protein
MPLTTALLSLAALLCFGLFLDDLASEVVLQHVDHVHRLGPDVVPQLPFIRIASDRDPVNWEAEDGGFSECSDITLARY